MRVDSCRTLFHLRIALSTVLEVVLILPEDKVDWFNDNDIHATLVPLLYESIVSQLVRGSTVVKKKKDLDETSRSLNQAGMFTLSYCFRWHGKARSFLIRVSKDA
ncbi:hypothetical protein BC940DRAFT_311165 [Gongronella butleri]|nr:hypothetical protein BC940DRAFT_311165 [Gongronella butleri]